MQRSFQGHIKVKLDKKCEKIYFILCLPTLFMRELSVIYDCSWIIQRQALFQKVLQVALG